MIWYDATFRFDIVQTSRTAVSITPQTSVAVKTIMLTPIDLPIADTFLHCATYEKPWATTNLKGDTTDLVPEKSVDHRTYEMIDKQVRGQNTQEFKLEAVRMIKAGPSVGMTAKVLGSPKLGLWP